MEIVNKISAMQAMTAELRSKQRKIAFVPTMGYLHEGHLELMRVAKANADCLIISIFVNPAQFGENEDIDIYPRDIEGDSKKAKNVGVDILFFPDVREIYPQGYQTKIKITELSQHLCGISRPGHFDGVATIVAKLFNIVKPHTAIFGEKDWQQLQIIRRMVTDLNMDIEIIGVPIFREPDGLALSSRNSYLSPEERVSALCLKGALNIAKSMVVDGERKSSKILDAMTEYIVGHPFTKIDYIAICDSETLHYVDAIADNPVLLALAVFIGKTRLIDNAVITPKTNLLK